MRITTLLARPLTALALCLPIFAGDVWIVDESGAGDFTLIQDAVDVAVDGDTILMQGFVSHWPTYVTIDGKALSLIHATPTVPLYSNPRITVKNLAAGQEVLLAGWSTTYFRLENNQGQVVLQSCHHSEVFAGTLHVTGCADVVMIDCIIDGWDHPDECASTWMDGDPGMYISGGSRVSLYGTTVNGGDGGVDEFCWSGWDGCGNSALDVSGGSSVRVDATTNLVMGAPNWCGWPLVRLDGSSTFETHTAPATTLIGPMVMQAGATTNLRVQGVPGEPVFLILSNGGLRRALPLAVGTLHLRPPYAFTFVGTIPGSGLLTTPWQAPALPPGSEAERVWAQAMVTTPAGRYLANPLSWVVVE